MGSSRFPPAPQSNRSANTSTNDDDPARRTFWAAVSSADPLNALFGVGGASMTRPCTFELPDRTVIPTIGVCEYLSNFHYRHVSGIRYTFLKLEVTIITADISVMGAAASQPYAYRVSDGGQTFDVFVRDVQPDGSFASHGGGTLIQNAGSS